MVDALDSKSSLARGGGSSPLSGTKHCSFFKKNSMGNLQVGSKVGFTADLDRGAVFEVVTVTPSPKPRMVLVTLKFIEGRWGGTIGQEYPLPIPVPKDFTQEDLHFGWFGTPNITDKRWFPS
jgi:hypothetical protein